MSPCSLMRQFGFGLERLRPFGDILRECLKQGFGDEKRLSIKHDNLVEPLMLADSNMISKWVNNKSLPETGRFKNLYTILSKGEDEPTRIAVLDALREAHKVKRSSVEFRLTTPFGEHIFSKKAASSAMVAVVGAVAVAFLGVAALLPSQSTQADNMQAYINRFEDSNSAVGSARIEISEALWRSEPQMKVLEQLMRRLPHEQAAAERRAFVDALIDGSRETDGLRAEVNAILEFFGSVARCVEARECDRGRAVTYFGPYADRFWANFGPSILARRARAPDYGAEVAAIAFKWRERN